MANSVKLSQSQKGFTLIELSIVMVIIGLVIGGVLVGQDLIRGAEVRSLISQIDKYSAGINAFRLKYNSLPGDFNQSNLYINSACVAGNGDGLIGSVAGPSTVVGATTGPAITLAATVPTAEHVEFWRQLSLLNLIEGSFTGAATSTLGVTMPYTKTNKGGVFAYGNTGDSVNYYHIGLANTGTTSVTSAAALSADDARNIDAKMDDGMPGTGIIGARGGTTIDSAPSAVATLGTAAGCVIGAGSAYLATSTYNTAVTGLLCQLRVRMN
jgi:prepilin-type N-terminal cleavage/methylation domain-containing protein